MGNLSEQLSRIKQLFTEERLYGNLVNEQEVDETEEIKNSKTKTGDLVDSGLIILKKSQDKWGEDNFIIKKNTEKTGWIGVSNEDPTDTISVSFDQKPTEE